MRKQKIGFMVMVGILLLGAYTALADPNGATTNEGETQRRASTAGTAAYAQAGNVTELDIDGVQITDIWQGYYGNVTGRITLDDANEQVMYNWTFAQLQGEIYATTKGSAPTWSTVNCSNQTEIYEEEGALNIPETNADSVNKTFAYQSHPEFYIGSNRVQADDCRSTNVFIDSGRSATDFYEVILTDDIDRIYAAILDEDQQGYNGVNYDFELLVPTDMATGFATYYFYVELS